MPRQRTWQAQKAVSAAVKDLLIDFSEGIRQRAHSCLDIWVNKSFVALQRESAQG